MTPHATPPAKRPAMEKVCEKLAYRFPSDRRANGHPDLSRIWSDSFFRLPATPIWDQLTERMQEAVQHQCSSGVLREALGIERTAMDYCARRVLVTDCPMEKQVYSLTAADEARHYHWLCSVSDPATIEAPPDAFTTFLAKLVVAGEPDSLSYLLQIILEGWGIGHYQRLAAATEDPEVRRVLFGIARDEGLHYAAGVAHFDRTRLSKTDRAFIRQALSELCAMIACGPLSILAALEQAAGGLRADERSGCLAALQDNAGLQRRLQQLGRFIAQGGMEDEAVWLAEHGLLSPWTVPAALAHYA